MIPLLGGCLKRLLLLVLLVAALFLAWYFREPLRAAWGELRASREGGPAVPSQELADLAESKVVRLEQPDAPERVVLTETEVQSLLEYGPDGMLPEYVLSPSIDLEDGRVRLRARVPTEHFPRLASAGEVLAFLPDTTELTVNGQLIPLDSGRVALAVDELHAARVPVPRRLFPGILRSLGRREVAGLPPDALEIPLPPGAATAYVRGDSLILLTWRGRGRAN
ncbi:MAG: hypothetical protein HY703_05495 [Gemmatimonadetes bacterium]|nr:hypothetical protein [Gemmatimonadota bacterium]